MVVIYRNKTGAEKNWGRWDGMAEIGGNASIHTYIFSSLTLKPNKTSQ